MMSEAARAIREARRVLVAAHLGPDVDAVGSVLAVGHMLAALGIERQLLLRDGLPYEGADLPGAGEIVRGPTGGFDLAVILDCPTLERIGEAAASLGDTAILNIDHHVTNTRFGCLNLVDDTISSTCQLVLRLVAGLGQPLSETLATCILTGLVGDTQGFRTSNTDWRALSDARTLLAAGADLWLANRRVFNNRPRGHLALWGGVLAAASLEDGLVWATIPRPLRLQAGVADDDAAGIVNFLIGTQGTKAAALFSEQSGGTVDVNLRSVPGVDVAAVAAEFGGGGHRQAAGFTVAGTLDGVRDEVLARLRQVVGGETVRPPAAG